MRLGGKNVSSSALTANFRPFSFTAYSFSPISTGYMIGIIIVYCSAPQETRKVNLRGLELCISLPQPSDCGTGRNFQRSRMSLGSNMKVEVATASITSRLSDGLLCELHIELHLSIPFRCWLHSTSLSGGLCLLRCPKPPHFRQCL